VLKEEMDFFASGHPLVEGLFGQLADGERGRVAFVKLAGAGTSGAGILFVFRAEGELRATAVSLDGTPRPDWSERILSQREDLRGVDPGAWRKPVWPKLVFRLAAKAPLPGPGFHLEAVAAFRLFP